MNKDDLARFEIDGALAESEPATEDLETWAQWYDRKAEAAAKLRTLAVRTGDDAGVATAQELYDKAVRAAAELRSHNDG